MTEPHAAPTDLCPQTCEDIADEVVRLRRELTLVQARLRRVDRDLAAARPLIEAVRALRIWDFTPYQVAPGDDWVAVDRDSATELLAALADIDHWMPWQTRIEPRPQ